MMNLFTKKLKAAVYTDNQNSYVIYESADIPVFVNTQDYTAPLSGMAPENCYTEINVLLPDNAFKSDYFTKKDTPLPGGDSAKIEENLAAKGLCAARIAPCISYAAEAVAEKHPLNNCAVFLNEQAFYTFALFDSKGEFLYVLSGNEKIGRLSKAERMLRAYSASVDAVVMEKLFVLDGTGKLKEIQKEAAERFNTEIQPFEAGKKLQNSTALQVPACLMCAYGAIR